MNTKVRSESRHSLPKIIMTTTSTMKCVLGLVCVSLMTIHIGAFQAPIPSSSTATVTKLQPLTVRRPKTVVGGGAVASSATARNMTSTSDHDHTSSTTLPPRTKPTRTKKNVVGNSANTVSSKFISDGMLNHDILTKQEERELGNLIVRAKSLRHQITDYLLQKELEESVGTASVDMKLDGDLWAELQSAASSSVTTTESPLLLDSDRYAPELDSSLSSLSETDIVLGLSVPGGRAELLHILRRGVAARRALVSHNIKLVTSIARTWMRRATTSSSHNTVPYATLYTMGSWDLPSLDEAVQEGVIGLTRAADKYEPSKDTKFSTYATYWITNYVRQCFYDASTGSLRLPPALHSVKRRHGQICQRHRELDLPPPTLEQVAREIGVNRNRVQMALQATQSLISLDGSITGSSVKKGSGAGMPEENGDTSLSLSDTLQW